jgi:hypothetical protein
LYITLRISGFLDFVHSLVFQKPESKMFRKLGLFLTSGEESKTSTVLDCYYFLIISSIQRKNESMLNAETFLLKNSLNSLRL